VPEIRAKLSAAQKRIWAYNYTERLEAIGRGLGNIREFLDNKGRLWKLKSSYELRAAEWLDEQRLTWVYEPCRLLLSNGEGYIPDFFVFEWGSYVEVKGYPRGLYKAELARQDGHEILIWDGGPNGIVTPTDFVLASIEKAYNFQAAAGNPEH
jgi:hypothetical protein